MIFQQKQILRREMRNRLRAINADERADWSLKLSDRLVTWLADRPGLPVIAFVPMGSEPDWWASPTLDPHRFAYPRVIADTVEFFGIHDEDALAIGSFGVREPMADAKRRLDIKEARIALIPGLAFDLAGRRLGRGRAIYDGILSRLSVDCFCLGVAFDCQIVPAVPTEEHDRPVHGVITPSRVILCERLR